MKTILINIMKKSIRPSLIPLFRNYIRYFPIYGGKRFVWQKFVDPYMGCADHEFVATTKFGGIIAGNTMDLIQRYIYYFGIWEPTVTDWIRRCLKPGDIFVDVGANIGYYTILASFIVGDQGRVVAVEASPCIFDNLKRNIERNRIRNTRALNLAVSDHAGKVQIFGGGEGNIGETSILPQDGSKFETEVDSATLDSIPFEEEKKRIRLVKIDVEGAECFVADGMHQLLDECPRMDVVIEIDPARLETQGRTAEDIFNIFEQAGYRAYSLENDYSALWYLTPRRAATPVPIVGPIRTQTEVVFTKDRLEDSPSMITDR